MAKFKGPKTRGNFQPGAKMSDELLKDLERHKKLREYVEKNPEIFLDEEDSDE